MGANLILRKGRAAASAAAFIWIIMPNVAAPYNDRIDVNNTAHVRYFAYVHELTLTSALELLLSCNGDRRVADEAAIAFKARFKQSII
jgi:hypothetical protein